MQSWWRFSGVQLHRSNAVSMYNMASKFGWPVESNARKGGMMYRCQQFSNGNPRPRATLQVDRMTSSGVVFQPYKRGAYEKQANLYPFSVGLLAQYKLRAQNVFLTSLSNGRILGKEPKYIFKTFGVQHQNTFYEFHNALSSNSRSNLHQVATSSLCQQLQQNPFPLSKIANTPRYARIKSFSMINQLQSRVFPLDPDRPEHTFAQVTVQYISEGEPLQLSGKNKNIRKPRISYNSMIRNSSLGCFEITIDPRGGEYYWHTQLRQSTWKRPSGFESQVVQVDPALGTLGTYGKTLGRNEEDGTVQQEHIVVFERPLFTDEPWKVAFF